MAEKKIKRGLGRGLDAFFGDTAGIRNIIIEKIVPNEHQPRKVFDEEGLLSLAETIKHEGIISPIIVTPEQNGTFKIVTGERRYKAAIMAGLKELPCIVKNLNPDEIMLISFIENVQREDLNSIEEAEAIKNIIDHTGHTHEKVGQITGRSRVYISNILRLLNLSKPVQALIINGKITEGHARCLVGMDNKKAIILAKQVIEKDLSVRELEELCYGKKQNKKKARSAGKKDIHIKQLEEILSEKLSRETIIKIKRGYRGEMILRFYDLEDLNSLVEKLKKIKN